MNSSSDPGAFLLAIPFECFTVLGSIKLDTNDDGGLLADAEFQSMMSRIAGLSLL